MKKKLSISLPKELIAVPEEAGMSSEILENLNQNAHLRYRIS